MKSSENLNQVFDIEATEVAPNGKMTKRQKDALALTDIGEMKEKDVAYVRGKLYEVAEKLSEAMNESLESAIENQHPRAWEVTGNLMTQCADVAEKLVRLQGTNQRMNEERPIVNAQQNNTTTTNNIMFSGSTQEMMAMLKEAQKENNK
jgi:hypothetical protein